MGAAIAVGGNIWAADQAGDAQREAAREQELAAMQNVRFLQEQGLEGQELIRQAALRGEEVAGGIPQAAITPIQPFADIGTRAFTTGQQGILQGQRSGPLADAIALAGRNIQGAPGMATGAPIESEVLRRSRLAGQSFVPGVQQQLVNLGRQGLGAAGDIAGIRARQAQTVGDIARQAGAGRASALIGQVPQISQQLQTGQEARLLSDVAGQRFETALAEQAAQLAGRTL
jgi:hypothetical protein